MKTSETTFQPYPRTSHAALSRFARSAIALAVCAAIDPAFAQVGANTLPTGPTVNAGQASVSTAGSNMTVNQATSRVSLGWESFSIGSKASVVFNQPSASSIALNRVAGNNPSQIFGSLSANGQVFLINPAGVVFAPGASVNVGGIVASTLNITDEDFMAGRYVFSGDSQASVVNQGSIVTSPGGYAALFGAGATNEGLIVAHAGTVAVAAGNRVVMDMVGDGLISVSVDGAAVNALAQNRGLIQADGGRVILSARAAGDLVGTVLNQTGVIEAKSASMRNGEIVLDGGSNGIVSVSGRLDASGTQPGQTGGKVTVTGNLVGLYGAELNASGDAGGGTILVGGDYQGKNPAVGNAFRTYVDTDTRLLADAVTNGNGGKVIVWADDVTRYYGSISARGGAQGGDGGFAEVSGKESLVYSGNADLRAPKGGLGTLLLDPKDIVIETGGMDSAVTADNEFADNSTGTSSISPTDLENALNGADVHLQANNDISVSNTVDASGGGFGSLTLEAGKSIAIQANVTLNGNFTAIANTANTGVVETERSAGNGAFTMNDGTSIDTATANGNIQISVQTGDPDNPGGFASGSITLSNLAAGNGHVYINQGGATAGSHILRTTSSLITADSVALEISNAANTSGTIGSSVTGPIRVSAETPVPGIVAVDAGTKGGNIFLEGVGPVQVGGATFGALTGISAGTGNVSLISDDAITQSEALSGNTLTVKTLKNGGAAITLNTVPNEFATVDLKARNAADDANAAGAISYQDATGFDVAAAHSTGTVTLTGGGAITDGASGTLTGSTLTVKTLNNSGAAITFDNAGHDFTNVDLRARDGGDANNAAGAITYVDSTGFTAAARSASTVSMTATTGNLAVDTTNGIVTDSGAVTLTALQADAQISNGVGGTINTSSGGGAAVTLQADNMSLSGSINSGVGLVTLRPNADAVAIQVGATAADGSVQLGISDTDLDTITTTGGVTIGSATNIGGITVVGAADQATGATITGGTFTLRSNSGNIAVNAALSNAVDTTLQTTSGNIVFGAAGSVTAATKVVNLTATGGNIQGNAAVLTNVTGATLNATASTGIGSTNAIETAVTTLAFSNTSGNVQVTDSLLTGVTVSGTNAGTGAVNITETLGDLTIGAADIVTNSGAVTLTNQAVNEAIISAAGSDISTIGGATVGADVSLIANNMNLAGATNSGTATTTLRQFTNNLPIDLGGADVAGATLGLTSAELDTITAGKIKIGDGNSGAMTVTAAIAPVGTSLLSLQSGSTISQNAAAATITETNLALRAVTGIDLDANDSALPGVGNTVTNLAAVTTGTGPISFRNNATMTVGVVDGVDGISTNDGAISVTVAGNSAGATNLLVDKVAAGNGGTVTLVASNPLAGAANIFEAPLGGGTGDSPDFDITTTGALSLTAKTQIGQPSGTAAGPIEISVGSLAFSTNGGTAYLLQDGDIELTTMTTQGDVSFEAIGTITVTGDLNVNGNTTLTSFGDGEDIIISAGIIRNNDSAGFVTLKAQRHVILDANGYVLAQNVNPGGDGKTVVTLNSDSNALNGGAIFIDDNTSFASITSNNGNVILGGGGNPLTAAAIGTDFNGSTLFNGIDLRGDVVAGTGNVNLRGQSFFGGGQTMVSGVTINSGGSITTTADNGSNTLAGISITGIGDRGTGTTQGVLIDNGSLSTTSGAINVTGTHVPNVAGGSNVGVLVRNGASITSAETANTAGAVILTGTGGAGAGDSDHGIVVNGATLTVSGANLSLVGTGGGTGGAGTPNSNSVGVQLANSAIVQTTGIGVVTLTGTGGATPEGFNYGIEIADAGTELRATDSSSPGVSRIVLVGVGGASPLGDNYGILVHDEALVTTNASNITFSGTGGASAGGDNYGIAVLSGGVVKSALTVTGAGTISFTGTGGAGAGSGDTGILISGTDSLVSTTADTGDISFTGTGGSGGGSANYGIQISDNAVVETNGAAQITMTGTGSATSNDGSNFGVWIDLDGVVRSVGIDQTGTDGKITITGNGGLGTGAGDGGLGMEDGGKVSTVDAEIELKGNGGIDTTGAGTSYGVYSDGGVVLTTGDGAIQITGVGGASAGGSNHGIFMLGDAIVQSTVSNAANPPAGTITLQGTGGAGATGGNNIGIAITDGTTVSSLDGAISFLGNGATGGGTGNSGVQLSTDALVTSTGLATIAIAGNGAASGTGSAYGIEVNSGAAITSTGTGTISLTGVGGGTAGGTNNYGVIVNGTGAADTTVSSVTGNITIDGTGGGNNLTTDGGNIGVVVSGDADIAILATGIGKLDITGRSGITGGADNYGVHVTGSNTTVSSAGTATSDITIDGTGRGTGTSALGVRVADQALVTTTGAGDIVINGDGSTTGTGSAFGIQVANGAGVVSNTGNGKITLTGIGGSTSGASGNDNYGVMIATSEARVTSVTGNILIEGTGGGTGGTSTRNHGVYILSTADVGTTGAATVTINGDSGATGGGSNVGVFVEDSGSTISSGASGGSITIAGNSFGTGSSGVGVTVQDLALITTAGAGSISVTGNGSAAATGSGIGVLADSGATISSVGGAGVIALTGTGGGTGSNNVGVQFGNDSRAISTGTGSITVTGTGAAGTDSNSGVSISDVNNATTRAGITTVDGAISVTGYRKGTGDLNMGVDLIGATLIESTGAGNITILGDNAPAVAYSTGDQANVGVYMRVGASPTGGIIRSTSTGDISITGYGSGSFPNTGAPFAANAGVVLEFATVDSQASGSVSLTGTGSSFSTGDQDHGVQLVQSSVLALDGDIAITGTRGGTGGDRGVIIQLNSVIGRNNDLGSAQIGTGAITITGTNGSDAAVRALTGTNIIGGDYWGGPITITGLGTLSGPSATANVWLDDTNIKTVAGGGGTGTVVITSPGGVTLGTSSGGNIDAGDSTVTITTNTDGTAVSTEGFTQATGSITTTNSTAGAVSITANTAGGGTGDILFRGITAGTGASATITLNSNAGDINEQADGLGVLTATGGNVVLSATGTGVIGHKGTTNRNPVRTVTANVTATTTDGTISILESNGATFTTVVTGNHNRIDLQSLTGDITLGTIGTAVTNTGAVNILARSGSILNDANTATRITGGTVTLNASNAIGASGANSSIDTTATAVAAKSGAGGTYLAETDGVDLTETTVSFAASDVSHTSVSPNNILTNHSTTGDYQLVAGGSITTSAGTGFTLNGNTLIQAGINPAGGTVADQDIVISNPITHTNNSVTHSFDLLASRNIVFNSGADLTSNGLAATLNTTLNADRDATGGGAIFLVSGSDISSNNGSVTFGGGATPLTIAAIGNSNTTGGQTMTSGVVIEGDINAGGGVVTVTGRSVASSTAVQGVRIGNGGSTGSITTTTGNVTVVGTGDGDNGSGNVQGVKITGDATTGIFTTTSGSVEVTGDHTATANTGGNSQGILVMGGSKVSTSGAGTLKLTGTGASSAAGGDVGVQIENLSTIQVVDAAATVGLTIMGTGGSGGANNVGIMVDNAIVKTTGTGIVTLDGQGGSGTSGNAGVLLNNNAFVQSLSATGGRIDIFGDGGAGTSANVGVQATDSEISTAGAAINVGTSIARATGGAGTIGNAGVLFDNSNVSTALSGAITVYGTGGNGSGADNHGVQISGGDVTTVGGVTRITGTGAGTGGGNAGVQVDGNGVVSTATGSATLDGTGAGVAATDYGVALLGGTVRSTGTGSLALIGDGLGVAPGIFTGGGGNTIGNGSMTGELLLRSTGSVGMLLDATILNSGGAGTVVTLNAAGGNVTQTAGGTITSDGLRFLGSGTFTIDQAGNAVNKISAGETSPGSNPLVGTLTYSQAGAVEIASLTSFQDGVGVNQTTGNGLNVTGDVNLTAGGITQSAPAVVSGTTTLDAGGNDIDLTNTSNDFGTVVVSNADDVAITDGGGGAGTLDLGSISVSGELTVETLNGGSVTNSGPIVVPDETTFLVDGNLDVTNPGNDFNDVTFEVAGNASLFDMNDLVVNTSTIGGDLTLTTLGSLNTAPFDVVTVGGMTTLNAGTGGVGTLFNDFHLDTDGTITLNITGTVPGSPGVSGFVVNDGAGLLNLITPPTGLVRFQVVEFQPPTPVTAASLTSKDYSELTLDEISDLLFVTDDPEGVVVYSFGNRIGLLPNGADVNRGGGIRMPAGLPQGDDFGRSFIEDDEERRRRTGR